MKERVQNRGNGVIIPQPENVKMKHKHPKSAYYYCDSCGERHTITYELRKLWVCWKCIDKSQKWGNANLAKIVVHL